MNKINSYLNSIILNALLLCVYVRCPQPDAVWSPSLPPRTTQPRQVSTWYPAWCPRFAPENLSLFVKHFEQKVRVLKKCTELDPQIQSPYLVFNSELNDFDLCAIYTHASEDFVREMDHVVNSSEESGEWHAIKHLAFIRARLGNCTVIRSIPYVTKKSLLEACLGTSKNLQKLGIKTTELNHLAEIIQKSLGKKERILSGGHAEIKEVIQNCDLSFLSSRPLIVQSRQSPVGDSHQPSGHESDPRSRYRAAGNAIILEQNLILSYPPHLWHQQDWEMYMQQFDWPAQVQDLAEPQFEEHHQEHHDHAQRANIPSGRWNRANSRTTEG